MQSCITLCPVRGLVFRFSFVCRMFWNSHGLSNLQQWRIQGGGSGGSHPPPSDLTLVQYWNSFIDRIVYHFLFLTSDNAFLAFWLVHSISVISSHTLVWPYMENVYAECAKLKTFARKQNFSRRNWRKKVDFASFPPTKYKKCWKMPYRLSQDHIFKQW